MFDNVVENAILFYSRAVLIIYYVFFLYFAFLNKGLAEYFHLQIVLNTENM